MSENFDGIPPKCQIISKLRLTITPPDPEDISNLFSSLSEEDQEDIFKHLTPESGKWLCELINSPAVWDYYKKCQKNSYILRAQVTHPV